MRRRAGLLAGAALAAAAVVAAAGCSAAPAEPTGTVVGTYIRVGGPAGTPNVPLPGTISFRNGDGSTISLSSDNAGTFTGQLPTGTYAVTAESSQIDGGNAPCSIPLTTRVQTGKTVTISLVCSIS
jgi:hypothetical protein